MGGCNHITCILLRTTLQTFHALTTEREEPPVVVIFPTLSSCSFVIVFNIHLLVCEVTTAGDSFTLAVVSAIKIFSSASIASAATCLSLCSTAAVDFWEATGNVEMVSGMVEPPMFHLKLIRYRVP